MVEFKPEHEVALRRILELAIAPDGAWVVYGVEENDLLRNRRSTQLWRTDVESALTTPLTAGMGNERLPAVAPDGQSIVYVTTDSDGVDRLMLVPASGGYPEQLLNAADNGFVAGDISGERGFCWSPDSKSLAVMLRQEPAIAGELSVEGPRPDGDPVVYTEIIERLRGGPAIRLCVFDLASHEMAEVGQAQRPLTSLSWSQAGTHISGLERTISGYARPDRFRYLEYSWEGQEVVPRFEFEGAACAVMPAPDGQRLAISAARGSTNAPAPTFYLAAPDGTQREEILQDGATAFHDIAWSAAGQTLYAIADKGIKRRIVAYDLDAGTARDCTDGALWIETAAVNRTGDVFAFVGSATDDPGDVWLASEGQAPRRLTTLNPGLDRYEFGSGQGVNWTARDGMELEGILVLPAGHTAGTPVPLVLHYHGGHSAHYGLGWRGPQQLWASAGYAVFVPNFRGSTGYGAEFTEAIRADIGGEAFQDCMTGVDHLVALGIADPERLLTFGHSWGGYKTNWTITQTDRFKAAVSSGSVANLLSVYGTRYSADVWEWRMRGTPWEEPENYWRWSPLRYADKATTPTLFLNGLIDRTTPPTQGFEMFTALRKHGVPAEYVGYPREGHRITEPHHRVDRERRILDWFERHLPQRS